MLPANSNKLIHSLQRLSITVSRSLSAAAAPLTDPLEDEHIIPFKNSSQSEFQVSTLDNGIKVASYDNGGAISRVVVAIKAGSRAETQAQKGLSHLMKNAAFVTNGGRSILRTVRETQQNGGTLECSNSRELLSRSCAFMRTKLPEMMENMAPGIVDPAFKPWEMGDVKAQCANDIATLDATAANLELLHKTAFRDGLGNSVYCDKLKLAVLGPADLEEFASQHYIGGGISVVGANVDHNELLRYSTDLLGSLPGGASVTTAQQYHGGELHMNTSNGFSYASLVGAGAGLTSADLPVFVILQRLLGSGTSIKWGSNTVSSRLNRSVADVSEGPRMVTALNVSYSDAGLFGVHAVASPSSIGAVLRSAVNEVKDISGGNITVEDLERAKNQVKAGAMMLSEGSEDMTEDLVNQVVFTGGYASPAALFKNIDSVTLEQVVETAKQVFAVKPTLVVTGDSSGSPYLDELL